MNKVEATKYLHAVIEQSRVQPDMSNKWPELVSIIDASGRMIYVSKSHEETLGFSRRFLRNARLGEFAHETDREAFESQLQTMVETQQLTSFVFKAHSSSGVVRIHAQGVPLIENDVFPDCYLLVGRKKLIVDLAVVAERIGAEANGWSAFVEQLREQRRTQATGC